MNHQDLAKYWLIRDDEGNVLSVNTEEAEPAKIVFTEGSVAPEWFNVLRASAVMYQQLSHQFQALQSLIDLGEIVGVNEELLSHFNNMQNGILLAQRVAIEGVENVAVAIDAQKKVG